MVSSNSQFFSLTYSQQGLWINQQQEPDNIIYNTGIALRILSEVNIVALRQTFQVIINREATLRSNFSIKEGQLVQEIFGQKSVVFTHIDGRGWDEAKLRSEVTRAHQFPYNLRFGSLFRVHLFTQSPNKHVLLMGAHHLVIDAQSWWYLLEKIHFLYPRFCRFEEANLPFLEYTYIDYIAYERDILKQKEKKFLAFWKKQLSKVELQLELPTDYQRPPLQKSRGRSVFFALSPVLTSKLTKLAKEEKVTLYVLLMASFQVLLYHYSKQECFLVGTPCSTRPSPGFEFIIGNFINILPLCADFRGHPTFKQFLRQVWKKTMMGLRKQPYPLLKIIQELNIPHDPSRSALVQVLFNFLQPNSELAPCILTVSGEEESTQSISWAGLSIMPFGLPQQEGGFDLGLQMVQGSKKLFGVFKYNPDLFKEETIQRMTRHFQTILESIVTNPGERVTRLSLLTKAEQQHILMKWNSVPSEEPQSKCIHQLFMEQVECAPDDTAIVFEGVKLTYRELNNRANQVAHYLMAEAIDVSSSLRESSVANKNVLVGICIERSLEMIIALLGILKAGVAYVPLDPDYPNQRLQFMIEDAQIQTIITKDKWISLLSNFGNQKLIPLDRDWHKINTFCKTNPKYTTSPKDLAYCIYTSGSTGQPKGVLVEHKSLFNMVLAQIRAFELKPESRVLQVASLNFDASISEIGMALCSGATLVLAPKEKLMPGIALTQLLQTASITHITLVPSFLALLNPREISNLQTLIVAGEPCPIDLARRWSKGRRFFNAYGPTEATVCATIADCSQMESLLSMPIGRPIDNTQVYVLDQNLQPVPPLVTGQLHISGVGLARGYLNRPDLTQEKFIIHKLFPAETRTEPGTITRLYKTGDLARYLPDGQIEFLGRIDHQVKVRGFRVELGEIEAQLTKYPGVCQCVVIVSEENNGQLLAYWTAEPETTISSKELRQALAASLPNYMVPAFVTCLEKMPLTPNGKIDRLNLPKPDIPLEGYHLPQNTTEKRLAQIWEQLLDIRPIGITDNFFDLGGHSLLLVQLMTRIQQEFDQEVKLSDLSKGSTIERLAKILDRNITHEMNEEDDSHRSYHAESPLVLLQPNGSGLPFFCIHPIGGQVLCYMSLAHFMGNNQPFYGIQTLEQTPGKGGNQGIEEMATHYIQAMQTVQPKGPYHLGGWSFGGLVAFEMAQQLQRRGLEVNLLALIESYVYGEEDWHTELVNQTHEADLRARFVQDLHYNLQENVQKTVQESQSLSLDTNSQVNDLYWQVFKTNWQALAHYRPQPYPGRIIFFWANQENKDSRKEWDKLVTQAKHHTIIGDHYSIMRLPSVKYLAQHLSGLINAGT